MATAIGSYSDTEDKESTNFVFDLEEEDFICEDRANVEKAVAQHKQEKRNGKAVVYKFEKAT